MLFARYELLLPQRLNDGTRIDRELFVRTWMELIEQFGAITLDEQPVRGVWTHELERFEDTCVKIILDLEDIEENEEFMRTCKEVLKARFDQLDIWIVAFPIRII